MRHVHAHHLGAELGVVQDLLGRNDAGLDDVLVVVDVVQEAVERGDALHQPLFHALPLVGGNDPGQQVERDQPLGAGAVLVLGAVHREGDADPAENHFRLFTPRSHHLTGLLRKPLVVALVVLSDCSARIGELLIHLVEFVHGTTNLLEP
ncbi:hypothetical protein FQZ97_1072640 [compost metagenome]